jgi:similar to stage IV sporulation protein
MLSSIWNYLAGYVNIKAEGAALERLLNNASRKGVKLSGVRRVSPIAVTARMRAKDFYALHALRRGMRCRISILEKRGLPFVYTRNRFRKVLLFGWLIVLALLFAASRYIWFVDIEGCETVGKEDIRQLLKNEGIFAGTPIKDMDVYSLGSALMEQDPRISWAGVTLKGVILSVEIKEAELPPEIIDDTKPANIYAAKDAMITKVTALRGEAMVMPGDTVRAGELLISGDLRAETAPDLFVHASGEVTGHVWYTFSAKAGPYELLPCRSGRNVPYTKVTFLSGNVYETYTDGWDHGGFTEYETAKTGEHTMERSFIPLTVETGICWELTQRRVMLSFSAAEKAALLRAESLLKDSIPKNAAILSKSTRTIKEEDGGVTVEITVRTEEQIGKTILIQDG